MGTPRIRAIAPRDIAQVAAIYNHYIAHTTASFEEHPVPVAAMQERVSGVLDRALPWLVAEEDGAIVGYAYAGVWNTRHAYRHTAEVSVYLAPERDGAGLGTALYGALFERLREAGIRVVIAVITLPNERSAALHEKMGMRKAGEFAEVGFKFDRWINVGYWHGRLRG